MNIPFSPQLYHWFVRPKWFTKKYIHDQIAGQFPLEHRSVLDFGCGTGANCSMAPPVAYLGVDPNRDRIRYANRLYPAYRFHPLESNELPMDNQSIDYVWIIAVLHHIPCDLIAHYLKEFRRVLKPDGRVIVIEPYLDEKRPVSNWFMRRYDNGSYIRQEKMYLQLFVDHQYSCEVHKKFHKCFLYNELFFSATPQNTGKEVNEMTVASQVKTALVSLKSAQASMEQFALETQNQEAKNVFTNAAQSTEQIVQQIEGRVQEIEAEEPQYKGF